MRYKPLQFHDIRGGEKPMEKQANRTYFELRERAERAAAKRATSDAARRVHQEMAQLYSKMQISGPERR
jgi:hypothetical protein